MGKRITDKWPRGQMRVWARPFFHMGLENGKMHHQGFSGLTSMQRILFTPFLLLIGH